MLTALVLLKIINAVFKWLPSVFPDFDLSSIPVISTTADLLNIIAWAQLFVPLDLISVLFTLSLAWLTIKLLIRAGLLIINHV